MDGDGGSRSEWRTLVTRVWACRLPEFGCPCPHPGQPDPARFLCKSCQPLPPSLAHGGHPAAHSHRNRPPSSPGPVATAGAAGRAATSALSSLRLQTGWAMTVRGKMKAGRGRWEASSRPCSPRDAPRPPPPCVGRDRPSVPKHSLSFCLSSGAFLKRGEPAPHVHALAAGALSL